MVVFEERHAGVSQELAAQALRAAGATKRDESNPFLLYRVALG
jgi:hypothetical protein